MSDHDFAADRRAVSAFLPPPLGAPAGLLARRRYGDGAVDRVTCRLGDGACASAHAAGVRQSGGGASNMLHRSLLRLQREYGNRYVGQVLRQAAGEPEEGGGMDAIERSIDQARGSGNGMDHATRSRMEGSFGTDFSDVRIHTDARADDLSRSLSARAFTTGRDVFFRQGEYSPGTSSGRELLAHELTHVVQQGGGAVGVQPKMTVSDPGDPQEVEADEMARAVMAQETASGGGGTAIARAESDEDKDDAMLAAKRASADLLHRQPETPGLEDEDERKKHLAAKADPAAASRRHAPA